MTAGARAHELRTARLRGERIGREHVDFLARVWQNPAVVASLGGPRRRAEVEAGVVASLDHWNHHGFGSWIWFDAQGGEPLGWSFLHHVTVEGEAEVELGYSVGRPERWGEGLASEMAAALLGLADGPLGLGPVVAFTLPTNAGSRRVMEKNGFCYERDIVHADLPHVLYRRPGPGRPHTSAAERLTGR